MIEQLIDTLYGFSKHDLTETSGFKFQVALYEALKNAPDLDENPAQLTRIISKMKIKIKPALSDDNIKQLVYSIETIMLKAYRGYRDAGIHDPWLMVEGMASDFHIELD